MDENSNDVDRLFKQVAQNAGGLAAVLDPAKAMQRGAKRRRFAKRRRLAASGAVVVALVVVFLVPLPRLHLFGSNRPLSATSSHTTTTLRLGVGPAGHPIPVSFAPTWFTAASLEDWWMLGSARCPNGTGTCLAIVRTTDGGATFAGLARPPMRSSDVTRLSFANALDGYAFDPQLWATTDGGSIWSKVAAKGPILQLETADGEAYALACTTADCLSLELLGSPVGSLAWRRLATPVPIGVGAALVANGRSLYVLGGQTGRGRMHLFLLYSDDEASSFIERPDPCTPGLGGKLLAPAAKSSSLWAVCPTGTEAETWLSDNGGRSWVEGGGGFPNSVQLAAGSSAVALVSPAQARNGVPPTALERTTDGGRSYSVVLSKANAWVAWIGYSSPLRAYALLEPPYTLLKGGVSKLVASELYESNDAGATWHEVAIKA